MEVGVPTLMVTTLVSVIVTLIIGWWALLLAALPLVIWFVVQYRRERLSV